MNDRDESDALQAARAQRRGVRAALIALESTVASSALDPQWSALVTERLQALNAAWAHHVAVTEGDSGLFKETLDIAPRLFRRTNLLINEHRSIMSAIAEALDAVAALDAAGSDGGVAEIRAMVTDVMASITRHRQRGADLVFEAYNIDIEGGG